MISAASPLHLVPGRRKTRRGVLATAAAVLATALVLAPGSVSPAMADGLTLNSCLAVMPPSFPPWTGDLPNDLRAAQPCENGPARRGNGAAISQSGHGNAALVLQRGKENSGTVSQIGNQNGFALLQFGRRNGAQIVQQGNGELGITIQGSGYPRRKGGRSRRAASLRLLTAAFGPGCAKTRSAMVIRDLGGDLAGRRGQVGRIHPCGRLMVS